MTRNVEAKRVFVFSLFAMGYREAKELMTSIGNEYGLVNHVKPFNGKYNYWCGYIEFENEQSV